MNFLYIAIFSIPIFLFSFQNCKTNNVNSPLKGPTATDNINYKIGDILQVDITSEEPIENQFLPINSDIKFKFSGADPDSDSYKWTIQRGFDSIKTDDPTTVDTYQTKFSKLGTYDISANAYHSTNLKTRASKRFVVGESCSPGDILEIELLSENAATFKIGASGYAVFALRDGANFTSIKWKVTLPSGQVIENEEDTDTLEVDLSSEGNNGALVVEVSATSTDTSKTECLTYRKKEVIVTSNTRPYFNPLSFTDGRSNIPVTLENNDVYKYERPETNRFVQIEVVNANSCRYQINDTNPIDFNCDGESIEISSSLDTSCVNNTITILASNNQGEADTKSYYNYCPLDSGYCYFGLTNAKQSQYTCPIELLSQNRDTLELDPAAGRCGTAENTCQIGQPQDTQDTATHYQWQCLGIGGGSTIDCQAQIPSTPSTTTSTTTLTTTPPATTVQGQCNNNVKYGCASSAAAANKTASGGYDRWHCPGSGTPVGRTATNCQKRIPVQVTCGRCDSYKGNSNASCTAGTFFLHPGHNTTQYRWTCRNNPFPHASSCAGKQEDSCTQAKSTTVTGQCNNNIKYGCASSTAAINKTVSGGYDRWHCPGSGTPVGNTATNCQKRALQVACGRCGSYKGNSNASCTAGTFFLHPGHNTTQYRWTCRNNPFPHASSCAGKQEDSCTQAKSTTVTGQCNNNIKYGCTSSAAATNKTVSGGYDRWHCPGSGTPVGNTVTNCQKRALQVACGRCGSYKGNSNTSCTAGTFFLHPGHNTTQYRWTCRNNPFPHASSCAGKQEDSCTQAKSTTVTGQCNNNIKYGCTSSAAATNKTVSGGYDRWHCPGSGNPAGNTATNCQKAQPPTTQHGQCNNSVKYDCSSSAAATNKTVSGGYDRWHCPGSGTPVGNTVTNCQKRIPVQVTCGRCGSYKGNSNASCTAGTFFLHPGHNTTQYRWTCRNNPFPHASSCAGKQEDSCTQAKPTTVQGQCNNNVKYGCASSAAATNKTASGGYDRWHCPGSGNPVGNTATNCQKTQPPTTQHGQCNNSVKYGCSSSAAATNKTVSGGYDRWHCPGSGTPVGRTATNCQKRAPIPSINGKCDMSDLSRNNICITGTLVDVPDTADQIKWKCVGSNGGSTDDCVRPNFGACGAGCTSNLFCATSSCTTKFNCHVKDVNGTCYPSCGYAAQLRGYGGYGPGQSATNNPDRSDDPHGYTTGSTCADLDSDSGYTNSAFSSFRSFTYVEGRQPWEVVERGGGTCCIRDKTSESSATAASESSVTRTAASVSQPSINGVCDSACGQCITGTSSLSNPSGSVGSTCSWTCSGSNGSSNDNCSEVYTGGEINPDGGSTP